MVDRHPCHNDATGLAQPIVQAARPIVADEPEWRQRPVIVDEAVCPQRVLATRWQGKQSDALNVRAQTPDDCHVVEVALCRSNIRLRFGGRTVQDGVLMPGMPIINEPGLIIDGLLRGPTEFLHLHVPDQILAECGDHLGMRGTAALPLGASPARDPAIERLVMALLQTDEFGSAFGRLYADSISLAMVTRLLDTARKTAPSERPKPSPLPTWRLKRTMDYIDGNLTEPVRLADLAALSGLTRMHFAAQFRAATGLRPHEYLLRRRIERAQELLRRSGEPIAEVAFQVGFQTQSHFTSTFKRFVGQPPHAWRRGHDPEVGL